MFILMSVSIVDFISICTKSCLILHAQKKINPANFANNRISFSAAALKYISAKWGISGPWYPDDVSKQALIDEFFVWFQLHIHAHVEGIYEQKVTSAYTRLLFSGLI